MPEERQQDKTSTYSMQETVANGCISLLWVYGMIACLYRLSGQQFSIPMLHLGILCYGIILVIAARKPNTRRMLRGITRVLLAVVLLIFLRQMIQVILYLVNQMILQVNSTYDQAVGNLRISGCSRTDITIGMILLSIVVLRGMMRLTCHQRWILYSLLTMAVIIATAFLPVFSTGLGLPLFLASWLVLWILGRYSAGWNPFRTGVAVMAAILVLLIPIATQNMGEATALSQWKAGVKSGWEELRYGGDTLPQGNLMKADELNQGEEERLEISFDTLHQLYLRGYVGAEYTGTSWATLPKSNYVQENTQGMLRWLQDKNFYPTSQYQQYLTLEKIAAAQSTLTIRNTGANRRFVYAPYEVMQVNGGGAAQEMDWQLQSHRFFGTDTYDMTLEYPDTSMEALPIVEAENTTQAGQQFYQAQKVYQAFVYEKYTQLDEEEKTYLMEQIFQNKDMTEAALNDVTTQIRLKLQELVTYREQPMAYSGEKEFTRWVLEEAKEGNSAYYATIAALAYRSQGIPARIAEGYYLSAQEAAQLSADGKKQAVLTTENAHVWVEVYRAPIGWMPVEVAPGFYYAQYTTQQIINQPDTTVSIQNQQKDQQLNGSTADSLGDRLQQQWDEMTTPQKVRHVIGMLLLVILIITFLMIIIQLQGVIRRRRIGSTGDIYNQVTRLLVMSGLTVDMYYPLAAKEEILRGFPTMHAEEYERFIALIQQERFLEEPLKENERRYIVDFRNRLAESVYRRVNLWGRIRLHLIYCII